MSLWRHWHCQPEVGMFVMKGYKKLGRVTAVRHQKDPVMSWAMRIYVDVDWVNGTSSENVRLSSLRTPAQELEDCKNKAEWAKRSAEAYERRTGMVQNAIAKADQFDFLRQVASVRKQKRKKTA